MEYIRAFIQKFGQLSQESEDAFLSILEEKHLRKGDIIAKKGEVPTQFYLLKSGIARSYFTDENNKEYTRTLFRPVASVAAFSALILGKPSRLTYDCLTDCEVYVGDFEEFKQLAKDRADIANMYARGLEGVFIRMEKRIYDLSVLDAKQRYIELKNKIPEIDNLILQYHIASYLNVTPVQMSRIRRDLYSK